MSFTHHQQESMSMTVYDVLRAVADIPEPYWLGLSLMFVMGKWLLEEYKR